MSKFKRHSKRICRSSVALLVATVLILSSILFVSAESATEQGLDISTTSGTADMFSAQIVDGVEYNTSSLTLDKLPDYMNRVLGTDELEEGKKPVSLSVMDADELTSITTVNEDGTNTLYLFDTPIKYVEDGSIKFIDNTIKKADNISEDSKVGLSGTLLTPITNTSGYTNTANCFAVNMPSTISQGVSLEYGDLKVSVFPAVLSSATANLKTVNFRGTTEEVVEYRDVFGNGIHLQYVPTNKGVKENIVLDKYSGVNTFKFTVNTGDYYPLYTEGEAIPFVDPTTDEITFILGQVDARDSYTGDETDGHFTLYNSLSLAKIKDGIYSLTVTVDSEFLANENTVYPVVIDPSVTLASSKLYDTTVYSGKPDTQTFYSSAYNIVGYHGSSYGTGIAMLKTTKLSSYTNINASRIVYAHYRAYEGSGKTNSMTVQSCTTATTWGSKTVTYNTLPTLTQFATTTVSKSGWHNFVITEQVRKWILYAQGNPGGLSQEYGFVLKSSSSSASSKHFCSAEYNGSYTPSVVIRYTPYMIDEVGTLCKAKSGDVIGKQDYAWGKSIVCDNYIYRFTVPESASYEIVTMTTAASGTNVERTEITLYNSSYTQVAYSDTYQGTHSNSYGDYLSSLTVTLAKGTYYVDVSDYDESASGQVCYLIINCDGYIDSSYYKDYTQLIKEFYVIGPDGTNPNCYAYAIGKTVSDTSFGKTPEEIYLTLTELGYTKVQYMRVNCIVVYANGSSIKHFSRIDDNVITSKLGRLHYVRQTEIDAYFPSKYGVPIQYYVK